MTDANIAAPVVVEPVTPAVVEAPVVTTPVVNNTVVAAPVTNVTPLFPDDWRDKFANGDQKEAQRLARFADPTAVWKSFRELENKMATTPNQPVLPANATPEQLTAYRKEIGVPDTAQDYELSLPEGMVIGKRDETVLSHMLEAFHANNEKPEKVNEFVNEYFLAQQEAQAQAAEEQRVIKATSEEALRAKWGGNYLPNINAVKNLLAGAGELADHIMTARLADGSLLGNNAQVLEYLANVALELNPAGVVVPGSSGNQAQAVDEELKGLKKLMDTDIDAWHRNKAAKARYGELLGAQMKMKAKGY